MFKIIFTTIIFLVFTTVSLADTCPSITDIKQHDFHGWAAFDSDDGDPLSEKSIDIFIKSVRNFTMAEWADEAPEGSSHCYYSDKNGQYMFAFLAKDNLRPDPEAPAWKMEGAFPRCHDSTAACLFVPSMQHPFPLR